MDIEGAEYDVLETLLNSNIRVNQILVEIHERFFPNGIQRTKSLLKAFYKAGYGIFAVSNTLEEISFIRRELI
jgi:EAL domain-containing protein (putative c-di-GMP-specific phosphodiesterase class I)